MNLSRKRNPVRRPWAILACVLVGLAWAPPTARSAGEPGSRAEPLSTAAEGRVILLGFDGADARTVRELMAASPGVYPTFEKLADEGTFAPLQVVAPPESPVSWAAINTGQNPAKTGVPGFIRRMLGRAPMPGFGHIEMGEVPLNEVADGAPIPNWSAGKLAGAAGGAVFVVVFLLALLAFRKPLIAGVLGLILGGVAAWGGATLRGFLPQNYPSTSNPNKALNVWDYAALGGVPSVVLDAAQAFDMPPPQGATAEAKVLAGLGLPDSRGGIGDWFIYTSNPDEFSREGRKTSTAGMVYRVDEFDGQVQTVLYGPENFWLKDKLAGEKDAVDAKLKDPSVSVDESLELSSRFQELEKEIKALKGERLTVPMTVDLESESANVTIGGTTQSVGVGEWSDFFEVTFELNWLVKVHAITRVRVNQLEPYFELFVDVLHTDPRKPAYWQPISSPADFSAELAHECGLYETFGWPTLTMPMKDRELDPVVMMEDVEFNLRWRERLTLSALERDDWRFLMSVFSTTDRVQHMMYQFYDETNPLYDAEAADREMTFFGETIKLRDAIPRIYQQMDRVIGLVLEKLEPDDTLMVCSDHGFQSFHTQVHMNNWLAENGYLTVRPGVSKKTRDALLFVDWSKTRVYAMGMGFLYVNMKGREPQGIVDPADVDDLLAELREKLLADTDPATGASFVKDFYVTKEIHSGPYLDYESDAILGFRPPYRVGWSVTLGGLNIVEEDGTTVAGPVFGPNESPWSGDHISMALDEVAGVFFCNRDVSLPAEGVHSLQLAPTALSLLGVTPPAEMDLPPLTVR